jgi:excisionase family DNA binding protein
MSITELASVLGISRSHCFALAARDALPVPVIRLGRRMVVSRAAVEQVLGVSLVA